MWGPGKVSHGSRGWLWGKARGPWTRGPRVRRGEGTAPLGKSEPEWVYELASWAKPKVPWVRHQVNLQTHHAGTG